MKILFFGTSNVALPVLERLVRHHEIVAVVTTPDAVVGRKQELAESPVAVLAQEMELKTLKPQSLGTDQSFYEQVKKLEPDVAVVVSYGKLIPPAILDIPKFKTLNIHFSLLPKYRGAAPLQYSLKNGDTETGITIFELDEKLDRGPIIKTEKYSIDPGDNFISLSQRLAYSSADLITQTLPDYVSGKLTPLLQDESQATFTKTISKQDGKIDWKKSATEIYNQFRAFYPWPGIWTTWDEANLKIMDCVIYPHPNPPPKGEGEGAVLPGGVIACGNGTFLQIKTLQLAGKKATDIKSFLNGYKNFIGSRLK